MCRRRQSFRGQFAHRLQIGLKILECVIDRNFPLAKFALELGLRKMRHLGGLTERQFVLRIEREGKF
jgi:hypothetical protein